MKGQSDAFGSHTRSAFEKSLVVGLLCAYVVKGFRKLRTRR
jgi:hypothetical protein